MNFYSKEMKKRVNAENKVNRALNAIIRNKILTRINGSIATLIIKHGCGRINMQVRLMQQK